MRVCGVSTNDRNARTFQHPYQALIVHHFLRGVGQGEGYSEGQALGHGDDDDGDCDDECVQHEVKNGGVVGCGWVGRRGGRIMRV